MLKKNSILTITQLFFVIVLVLFFLLQPFDTKATISSSASYTHLGQTDVSDSPDATKGCQGNLSPKQIGQAAAMAFDTVNHRLYILEYDFNRAIYYSLNTDNTIQDNLIDGVIGQADLYHGCKANRGSTTNNNTLSISSLWTGKGIYVDNNQNLWISDQGNNRVLRFPSPIAGDGTDVADKVIGQADFVSGSANRGGSRSNASFNGPAGLFLDASENLWVADSDNNRILRFPSPVAGDGTDTADKVIGQADFVSGSANRGGSVAANGLSRPRGIELRGDGLYVADNNNRVIRFPNPIVGDGTDAANWVIGQSNLTSSTVGHLANRFSQPTYFDFDSVGNIVVSDLVNHRVVRYTNPVGDGSDSANAVLGQPGLNNPCSGSSLNRCLGDGVVYSNGLSYPYSVIISPGEDYLLIADMNNSRIVRYGYPIIDSGIDMSANFALGRTSDGADTFLDDGNWIGTGPYTEREAFHMAMDRTNHKLYVIHRNTSRVSIYNLDDHNHLISNQMNGVIGQPDTYHSALNRNTPLGAVPSLGANTLFEPRGVAVDSQGNVWIADTANNRAVRYPAPIAGDGTDTADKVIGQADFISRGANRGGARNNNTLSFSWSLALDSSDNLWIADSSNNRVLRFPAPIVGDGTDTADKVIGQADFTSGSANRGGSVAANSLSTPNDVFFDGDQNLYISDQGNNRVVYFSNPVGDGTDTADKVIGQADFTSGSANRGGSVAANGLSSPLAITKVNDDFYIVDTNNHRVLRFPGPLAGDGSDSADLVLGQNNFISGSANKGMSSPDGTSFNSPREVFFNGQDQILVSDFTNGRVMIFNLYPIDSSLIINNNAATASSQEVQLTLFAGEASEMIISNNSDFAGSGWEPYSTFKNWQLTSSDGPKTVYVQFRDSSEVEAPAVSDSIYLLTLKIIPETGAKS